MNKQKKGYPFIKQVMPIPENMEAQLYDDGRGEWFYAEDDGWYVLLSLVEDIYEPEGKNELFSYVGFYVFDGDGVGELEDKVRLVRRRTLRERRGTQND